MTEQHTVAMRFVRGASAPAPLADPPTEEEAVLVSDTQAAIQRLRDAVVATVGLHPLWTTCVLRSDLATLLDALDAAGPLLAAAREYAAAEMIRVSVDMTSDDLDVAIDRWEAARDALHAVALTATPRAADPE